MSVNVNRNADAGTRQAWAARGRYAGVFAAGLLVWPSLGASRVDAWLVAPERIIAIGGGLKADNERVLGALARPDMEGKIVIVPFASGDQKAAATNAIELLKPRAPKARFLVLPDPLKDAESRDLAIAWIPTADLVYFTGGYQSRITQRFFTDGKPNGLVNALVSGMQRSGTPVAGTSAGAAVLCNPMFTGGVSDAALGLPSAAPEVEADDSDAEWVEPATQTPARPMAKPVLGPRLGPGLGLVNVMLDTHFFSRGRLGRLVAAAELHPSKLGIGIADNRAVSIGNHVYKALGDAACLVVDARHTTRERLDRVGVRVSLLNDGDEMSFLPSRGKVGDERPPDGEHAPKFGPRAPLVNRAPGALKLIPIAPASSASDAKPKTATTSGAQEAPAAAQGGEPMKAASAAGAWDRDMVLSMLYRLAADPATPQTASSEKFTITLSADEKTRIYAEADGASCVTVIDARLDIREKK